MAERQRSLDLSALLVAARLDGVVQCTAPNTQFTRCAVSPPVKFERVELRKLIDELLLLLLRLGLFVAVGGRDRQPIGGLADETFERLARAAGGEPIGNVALRRYTGQHQDAHASGDS